MKRRALLLAVLVVAVLAGGAGYQSWKGMLVARPGLDTMGLALTDYRIVAVLAETINEEFSDSLTTGDVEGWCTNRLRNMGLRVVSDEEQNAAYDKADRSTDERMLRAGDLFRSQVYVNMVALKSKSGTTSYYLRLECKRGVFVHPGYFTYGTVWSKGMIQSFGSDYDAKVVVREALNDLLDLLEKDWKRCNK